MEAITNWSKRDFPLILLTAIKDVFITADFPMYPQAQLKAQLNFRTSCGNAANGVKTKVLHKSTLLSQEVPYIELLFKKYMHIKYTAVLNFIL